MPDFREADFPIFQFLVVVVHVFSAIIWIGGSIFLTLVMILALLAISGALALDGRGI